MMKPNDLTFKESIIKMYELLGENTIVLGYDELPGMDVIITIEKTKEDNENECI